MSIITLTTDFGQKDGFVGVIKGILWSINRDVQVADISNDVSPQNILEASLVLHRVYSFFPSDTVHLAIVDPGVGTQRRPIAARIGEWYFVGPDNGLFTLLYHEAEEKKWKVECVHLVESKYFLPRVSNTFHGRDIFAPVAAHLSMGIHLSSLGPEIKDLIRITFPTPDRTSRGWIVHVIGIDHFGNLATNLPARWLNNLEKVRILLGQIEINGVDRAYGDRESGGFVALIDSAGWLEIAVTNGNAARITGAVIGTKIEVVE